MWSVEQNIQMFLESAHRLVQRPPCSSFDKDDIDCLNFVTAASNLRAHIYHIDMLSRFSAKAEAGNIIPAIATTNAVIAGLIVLEAFKILTGKEEECRNVYLNKRPSGKFVFMLCCVVLCCVVLCCVVLCCVVLCCVVLCCVVLCCVVLCCVVLCCVVLCCVVLCCVVLFCFALFCFVSFYFLFFSFAFPKQENALTQPPRRSQPPMLHLLFQQRHPPTRHHLLHTWLAGKRNS